MRIHNPSITGSLSISGSGLSIDGIGTFSGSSTSTGSFGSIVTNTRDVFRYGVQAISNDAQDNPAVDGRGGGILIENLNSAGSAMLRMRGGDGAARIMYGENNSTDKLLFSPRNAATNFVTLDHLGRVGIDVSSTQTLSVQGDTYDNIGILVGTTLFGLITCQGSDIAIKANNSNDIVFHTDGSERVNINHSGNVGIGTSSPSSTLEVLTNDGINVVTDGSTNTPARLNLWSKDTSIAANDTIAAIYALGTDSTSTANTGSKIEFNADAVWDAGSANYQATRIDFFAQNNSGTNTLTAPALQVAHNKISGSSTSTGSFGMLGIGVASPNAATQIVNTVPSRAALNVTMNTTGTAAMNITNTSNANQGLYVYSNHSSATSPLSYVRGDHTSGYANVALFAVENDNTSGMAISSKGKVLHETGDLEVRAGNISGSATSTGSFGSMVIGGQNNANAQTGADTLVVQDGMTIFNTGTGRLNFSDGAGSGDESYKGVIKYSHSSNVLTFAANAVDRVSLNADGVLQTLHVSGSSTSTGSFGYGRFANKVGVGSIPGSHTDAESPSQILSVGENQDASNKLASIQILGRTSNSTGTVGALEFINTRSGAGVVASIVGIRYNGGSYADGALQFNTKNGSSFSTKMTINDAGNVGIGTASPAQILHLKGAVPSILFDDSTNGYLAYIGDAQDFLTGGSPGADSFGIRSEGDIRLGTGGNNLRMVINSSGNVGIGATSPAEMLHISGSEPSIRISDTAAAKHFNIKLASGGGVSKLRFNSETHDNTLMVTNDNRVGIGVGSPAVNLHIEDSQTDTDFTNNSLVGGTSVVISNQQQTDNTFSSLQLIAKEAGGTDQSAAIVVESTSATTYQPKFHIVQRTGANTQTARLTIDETGNAIFSGNVSGSSTSTSSFGHIFTRQLRGDANDIKVQIDGYGNQLAIDGAGMKSAAHVDGFRLQSDAPSATNPNILPSNSDENTGIGRAGADELSLIAGGVEGLRVEATKISGSASSTGSFGQLVIGMSTNLDVSGDVFVKNDAVGASATFVGDGAADTSKIRLGTSWGRHWSFIASPYDTYAPGNAYDLEIGYTLDNANGDYNELSGSIVFNNYKNVAFMGSGSVGIGTREPSALLAIKGGGLTIEDTGEYLRFTDGNASIRRSSNDMQFYAYSGFIFSNVTGESFRVDNSANLLIAAGNNITFAGAGNVSGSSTSTGSFGNIQLGDVTGDAFGTNFYEEGEYTPTITPQGSGTITVGSSYDKLRYTRMGRVVHVQGNIIVDSVSSPAGTHVAISLPFTSANDGGDTSDRALGQYGYYDNSESAWAMFPLFVDENQNYMVVHYNAVTGGGLTMPNVNTIAANDQFRIDLTFTI